jgi:hypothetical protein
MYNIGDIDPEVYWGDFEINTKGMFLTAHWYTNIFGGKGTFVSVTSGTSLVTLPGISSYGKLIYLITEMRNRLDLICAP